MGRLSMFYELIAYCLYLFKAFSIFESHKLKKIGDDHRLKQLYPRPSGESQFAE
jgi:hypothetical protein